MAVDEDGPWIEEEQGPWGRQDEQEGMERERVVVAYQLVEYARIQFPFGDAAIPELLVAHLEALPVLAELGQAVFVDVFDPVCRATRKVFSSASFSFSFFS